MLNVDLPGAVLGFVGVHLGLRSEVGAVERAVDDGDLDAARRRACLLQRVLYNHHHAEDHVLFPAVRERPARRRAPPSWRRSTWSSTARWPSWPPT